MSDLVPCPDCSGKWAISGGGQCGLCRYVDRISASVRGSVVPAEAGQEVLTKLRICAAEIQDLGELHYRERGSGPGGVALKKEKEKSPEKTKEKKSRNSAPAATPKSQPKSPNSPPKRKEAKKARGSKDKKSSSEAKPSRPSKRIRSSSSSPRRKKKHSKRSPSEGRGRSSRRERSPRFASPVRVGELEEVKEERLEEGVKEEEAEEDKRGALERRPAPTRRPTGAYWQGPIYARRWEPPPGTGKHYGKDKGERKRERRRNYLAGCGWTSWPRR